MPAGECKWYSHTKGYGFLVPDEGGPDVFVHSFDLRQSNIRGLVVGERLSFDAVPGKDDKPRARNIKRLGLGRKSA